MLFEIEVNGRTRRVTVEPVVGAAHRFTVTVDGHPHVVDGVTVDSSSWSLVFPDEDGRSVAADVDERPGGTFVVALPRSTVTATVDANRRRRSSETLSETGDVRVVSPMPGRVLRVLVGVGQHVEARQPLVVVEAMKMENEMSSARPGRVKEILVTEGVSVEAGRLLAIVE